MCKPVYALFSLSMKRGAEKLAEVVAEHRKAQEKFACTAFRVTLEYDRAIGEWVCGRRWLN